MGKRASKTPPQKSPVAGDSGTSRLEPTKEKTGHSDPAPKPGKKKEVYPEADKGEHQDENLSSELQRLQLEHQRLEALVAEMDREIRIKTELLKKTFFGKLRK